MPIWIVIFDRYGKQMEILRCRSEHTAEGIIYHNSYYGRRCLKITVKEWKGEAR
jgi:hypothetical protein